jgi:hypothetical protein
VSGAGDRDDGCGKPAAEETAAHGSKTKERSAAETLKRAIEAYYERVQDPVAFWERYAAAAEVAGKTPELTTTKRAAARRKRPGTGRRS